MGRPWLGRDRLSPVYAPQRALGQNYALCQYVCKLDVPDGILWAFRDSKTSFEVLKSHNLQTLSCFFILYKYKGILSKMTIVYKRHFTVCSLSVMKYFEAKCHYGFSKWIENTSCFCVTHYARGLGKRLLSKLNNNESSPTL